MKDFMSIIDVFLKHRARKLSSFAVIFQVENQPGWRTAACRLLKERSGQLIPYNLFFGSVLELLQIQEDEQLERLQLYLEFGFRQTIYYDKNEQERIENEFWKEIEDHCPMDRNSKMNEKVEQSKDSDEFGKLICRVRDKVKKISRGDKLIVKCIGIRRLIVNCVEFLRFWFKNEDIAVDYWQNHIEFVAQ